MNRHHAEQEPLLGWDELGFSGLLATAVAQAEGLCDFMARMSDEAAARLYDRLGAMRQQKRQASESYERIAREGQRRVAAARTRPNWRPAP